MKFIRKKKKLNTENNHSLLKALDIQFLAHELKDPVSVIETAALMLLERADKYGELTEKQQKTLNRILRGAKKTRSMINSLLEAGRAEAGVVNCSKFNPAKTCFTVLIKLLKVVEWQTAEELKEIEQQENIIHNFLFTKGIYFNVDPCIADIEIFQDEVRFSQIAGNLLKNAFHHKKDRIEINIKEDNDKNFFLIQVADDGPGIEPENHNLIFEKYTSLNKCNPAEKRGHGLGLAAVRIFVSSLDGNVKVESDKGKGAVFTVRLPKNYT